MNCARTGDAAAVAALLRHGADVNASERAHQQTALMWAAAERHPEVVAALLGAGADVRARSLAYPQTVVGEETQRAGREALNYTVLRGGSTPLLFAARVGDVESARLLLEAGADANDALPDGISALMLAAHSGHGQVAALLLENGADPERAAVGYTALHAAVLRGDLALVKALLARGANPNVRITKGTPMRRDTTDFNLPATLIGSTPYLLAARFLEAGDHDGARRRRRRPEPHRAGRRDALMLAAGMGSSRTASRRGIETIDFGKVEPESRVRETVARGGGPAAATSRRRAGPGDTALHVAAALGYDTVVQFLADHGADITAKNTRGITPLAAAMFGSTAGKGRAAAPAGADSLGFEPPDRARPPEHRRAAEDARRDGRTCSAKASAERSTLA